MLSWLVEEEVQRGPSSRSGHGRQFSGMQPILFMKSAEREERRGVAARSGCPVRLSNKVSSSSSRILFLVKPGARATAMDLGKGLRQNLYDDISIPSPLVRLTLLLTT